MTKRLTFLIVSCFTLASAIQAQRPTTHASQLKIQEKSCHKATIGWTRGNGSSCVVWLSEGAPLITTPTDGTSYNANSYWGNGVKVGNNAYCVYDGAGNSIEVTGLKNNRNYYVNVFEYNFNQGAFLYLTTGTVGQLSFITNRVTALFTIDKGYQCFQDNKFTFTNYSTGPTGDSLQYLWDFGDGNTDTTKNVAHSYTYGGIFEVELTAISSSGCKTTVVHTDTVVVPYNVSFELDPRRHSGDDTTRCFTGHDTFEILNTSRVPNPPIYGSWDRSRTSWSTNQGHSSTAYNFDFNTSIPGEIRVQQIISRQVGRGGLFCPDTAVRYYKLNSPFDPNDLHIDTISNKLKDNRFKYWHSSDRAKNLQWNLGDGTLSNQDTVYHSFDTTGQFNGYVSATGSFGCNDTLLFTSTVVNDVSVHLVRGQKMVVAPNPTSRTITLLRGNLNHASFQINDLTGKIYQNAELDKTQRIDVSTLPKGVYILTIDGYAPVRFIKL